MDMRLYFLQRATAAALAAAKVSSSWKSMSVAVPEPLNIGTLLAAEVKPGVTTLQLDKLAEEFIRDHGAVPGFLGLYDFPNTLCMSPNEQVVHGFPNDTPLEEGDIISIDCGAIKNEFYGDHAYTFEVGEVDEATKQLLEVTFNI